MADIRKVTESFAVAPQIDVDDFASIQEDGFKFIINNRPDEETFGQMPGATANAKATEFGMGYKAVPISGPGDFMKSMKALNDAIAESEGPVLAYCRSGTRSISLWSLAQVKIGAETPETAIEKAKIAGYDLSHLEPTLKQLAGSK